MGVITELTMRLASTERDPDKPFGAPLGRSAHVASLQWVARSVRLQTQAFCIVPA